MSFCLITIIVPCYNPPLGPFAEMLEALAHSTFQDFNLIIVDDGSQDTAFLNELDKHTFRVQIIRHAQNRGLSAARNSGAAACVTPYYVQLDADDQIEPTFVEKCLWALQSHPEWSFCNSWVQAFGARSFRWNRGFDRPADFRGENQVTSIAMIRHAVDRAIGGHDESIRDGCEDWDYWLKMAAHGFWGGTIPEYLICYRHYETPRLWPNRDDADRRAEFLREMKRRYPTLWRDGLARLPGPPIPSAQLPEIGASSSPPGAPVSRVLFIVPWLTLGGADRFNLSLIQQLQAQGYEVTVLVTTRGPHLWLDNFLALTKDVFILNNFLTPEQYPQFVSYLSASRRIELALISNAMLGYALLPVLRLQCPNMAIADYVHMVPMGELNGGYARISAVYQNLIDLHIVSSQFVRNWMIGRGIASDRVSVCYTHQDIHKWTQTGYDRIELRRQYHLPDSVTVILYPARLEPQKRPRILLDILAKLKEWGPDFICLIAGQGPLERWLQVSLRRRGLSSSVRLLGAVAADDMPAIMAMSDILLLPSLEEGISLAIYEAMAMGLPIVSAAVGGQAELVTPECGYLIQQGPKEISQYVAILESLCREPVKRKVLGEAARQRIVQSFRLEKMGEEMKRLLTEAYLLHRDKPLTLPTEAESRAAAQTVIEDIRLDRMQELLRAEQGDWRAFIEARGGTSDRGRTLTYKLKRELLRPLYYWMLANGMDWVVPIANRTYRKLQRFLR